MNRSNLKKLFLQNQTYFKTNAISVKIIYSIITIIIRIYHIVFHYVMPKFCLRIFSSFLYPANWNQYTLHTSIEYIFLSKYVDYISTANTILLAVHSFCITYLSFGYAVNRMQTRSSKHICFTPVLAHCVCFGSIMFGMATKSVMRWITGRERRMWAWPDTKEPMTISGYPLWSISWPPTMEYPKDVGGDRRKSDA